MTPWEKQNVAGMNDDELHAIVAGTSPDVDRGIFAREELNRRRHKQLTERIEALARPHRLFWWTFWAAVIGAIAALIAAFRQFPG